MNKIKKIFLLSCLVIVLSTSFSVPQNAEAANIFGVKEAPGCESKDPFLPVLVICGRSKATGACEAYQKQCTVGDLVATGGRFIIWIISFILLIVPLLFMYYGAQMIIQQSAPSGGDGLKKIKDNLGRIVLYFILLLAGWLIVRTVVDIFQVDTRINTFLLEQDGSAVKAKNFEIK